MSWTKFVRSKLHANEPLWSYSYCWRPTYQSRQLVLNTPLCSVMSSSVEASVMQKPNLSMWSEMLSKRLIPERKTKLAEQGTNDMPNLPEYTLMTTNPYCIVEVKVRDPHIVPHCYSGRLEVSRIRGG